MTGQPPRPGAERRAGPSHRLLHCANPGAGGSGSRMLGLMPLVGPSLTQSLREEVSLAAAGDTDLADVTIPIFNSVCDFSPWGGDLAP